MTSKKLLISVIITYYKKRKFIKKTLKSILNQSYKNLELIFVFDDNNKEDLPFIKQQLKNFKKKKLIINKANFGVAYSRNLGIKNSTGKYLAFIDSDDLWRKNKISKQLRFMKEKMCHLSFTSYNIINEKGNILRKRMVSQDAKYENLIKSNFIGLSTVMISRKIINHIKFPELKTQEDFALWLSLLNKGYKLAHLKNNLVSWRKTKDSLSSNKLKKVKDAFKLFYNYQNKNLIFSIFSVIILIYNKILK